jgi:predicted metalloprotease with PDZ domain
MANIQYTISPLDGNGHYFQVDLLIKNPNPKGQVVTMPNWIPGSYMIRDFSKHIRRVHCTWSWSQIALLPAY